MGNIESQIRFRDQLRRQLGFLQRSCNDFDKGHHDEAIRIATTIRILIHDTKRQTSLLKHLNAKEINLLSTCPPPENENLTFVYEGLTIFQNGTFHPKLDKSHKVQAPLENWWNQIIMIQGHHKFTRKSLVLTAADKDGGAHVDKRLTPEYEVLINGVWNIGGTKFKLTHLISLRQIGFEILNSPELLQLVDKQRSRGLG